MQNAQTIASDPPKHSIGTWNGASKDAMKLIISAGTEMWPGACSSGETVVMVVRLHPCRLTHTQPMNTLSPTTTKDVETYIGSARAWVRKLPNQTRSDYFAYTHGVNAIYPGATKLTDRQVVKMYKGANNIQ